MVRCETLLEHLVRALDLGAFTSLLAVDRLKVQMLSVVAEFVF